MTTVVSAAATTAGVSNPSDSLLVTSPTLSASSLSSSGFDFVTVHSQQKDSGNATASTTTTPINNTLNIRAGEESSFSDDDEIVWTVSESEDIERSTSELGAVLSDDDFVVLGRTDPLRSRSRVRTKTSGPSTTQSGTVRGIQATYELEHDFSTECSDQSDVISGGMPPVDDSTASALNEALATLKVDDSPTGEARGTKTPGSDLLGALPKNKGGLQKDQSGEALTPLSKKGRKEKRLKKATEDGAPAKKEKKKKKKDSAATDAEPKEKKSKRKTSGESVAARPVTEPGLTRSTSTATLVPSQPSAVATAVILNSQNTPADSPTAVPPEPSKKKKKKGKKEKAVLTAHSPALVPSDIVAAEKVTEERSNKPAPTAYNEAVGYITSYISNASAHGDRVCHLTLLQSLIIELGLIKDLALLPRSINSAKKVIKARVFLNVKEYLTKRHQGPETVQGLLFPTRAALVKDMRKKKNFASLAWIKKQGLQDLLVGVFRH